MQHTTELKRKNIFNENKCKDSSNNFSGHWLWIQRNPNVSSTDGICNLYESGQLLSVLLAAYVSPQ